MDLVGLSNEQRAHLSDDEYDELQHRAWLLMTANFADCFVSCGGSTVQLHRDIICPGSRYFRAALAGGFMEGHSSVLVLQEVVCPTMVFRIIKWLYLSNSKVDHGLDVVYGPMDDVQFYEMAPELYRHADYLKVEGLMAAIIKDLKERLDKSTRILRQSRRPWLPSNPDEVNKAMQDAMAGAVLAFDKAKKYYDFYEAIRSEFLVFVERCHEILPDDEFEDYLRQAPDLLLYILKNMRHIKKSTFITPGPQVRCTFCNKPIPDGSRRFRRIGPSGFGILADRNGGVKYVCSSSKCLGKIKVNSCFMVK